MQSVIGILGGTFNPIHQGHLNLANTAYQQCHLNSVFLMPNHIPPHRALPSVSTEDRIAMIQCAIANQPHLALSRCEVDRDGPSYMVDSLAQLKATYPNAHLALIMGADSLEQFPSWHRHQEILKLAHLIVFPRPGYNIDMVTTRDISELSDTPAGAILAMEHPAMPISSTQIRQNLIKNREGNHGNLPKAVLAYILEHQLYTR